MKAIKVRKKNITGIKGLSIGSCKNDRGYVLTRYIVNYKLEEGKAKGKSFYFGARQSQIDAFNKACEFMLESDLIAEDLDCSKIYKKFKHEKLLQEI